MPIVSLWANKIGISSTRSVVTVNCSVMPTAYRIFKILSPFDRTMSKYFRETGKDFWTRRNSSTSMVGYPESEYIHGAGGFWKCYRTRNASITSLSGYPFSHQHCYYHRHLRAAALQPS